jgi:tetratricopeptide (TPR) repeat protein
MDAQKARREAETRRLQQAVARLDEQLASKPDDLKLLELRAKAGERLAAWDDAANFWQRLVKGARNAGDRSVEARACLQAGVCLSRGGQPNKGLGFLQRAVAAWELLRDEPMTARARVEQARHHVAHGDDAKARPLLELAVGPLESAEAWDELGWVRRELSRILCAQGGAEAGLEHARHAVEATVKAKDGAALGERLAHLAGLHQATGSPAKARQYYERALPYLKPHRRSARLLAVYDALVAVARAEEDTLAEERWLIEAALLVDVTPNQSAQGRFRVELATLLGGRDPDRARHLLHLAIERFHRGGNPHGAATAYRQLGALLAPSDREGAQSAFARAIDFFRMVGDDQGAGEVVALSAQVNA